MNRNPHDPNKGLNVRTFSISILIALVALLVGAYVFVLGGGRKIAPGPKPLKPSSVSPQ